MGSPFLNISTVHWLDVLERSASAELIEGRLEGRRMSSEDKQALIKESGRHPFLLQQLLSEWIRRRSEEDRPRIEDIAEAVHDKLLPYLQGAG